MSDIMFDVRPLLDAHDHGERGREAWELCKLSAFMARYEDAEPVDYIEDEERILLDLPRV